MAEEFADQLRRIKANILTEVEKETAYRVVNGPKPTYMANGRRVEWNEWLKAMLDAAKDLDAQIATAEAQDDPYELHTTGWT